MLNLFDLLSISKVSLTNFSTLAKEYAPNKTKSDLIDFGTSAIVSNYNQYSQTNKYHFENEKTAINFIETVLRIELLLLKINHSQAS